MKVVVIDGQSGRMGQVLIERIRAAGLPCRIIAVGTNAIATSAMLKAGADAGATGENPVLVNCRDADVIAGPIGILAADSLLGEITPVMATAVAQSSAKRILIPFDHCDNLIVGVRETSMKLLIRQAVEVLRQTIEDRCLT